MGNITLTIVSPLDAPPTFESELQQRAEGPDAEVIEEILEILQETGRLTKGVRRALEAHAGFLIAQAEVRRPGDTRLARAAARLIKVAFDAGALAVLVEETGEVLLPGELDAEGHVLTDPTTLFHLFVQIFVEEGAVCSEGMQIFALPDARVPCTPETLSAAQGAAFAFTAKLLLERLRPTPGGAFRASESAPLYRTRRAEDAHNPSGAWVLELEQG